MLYLPRIARAEPADLAAAFKTEVAALSPDDPPLPQGMAYGNAVRNEAHSAMVLGSEVDSGQLRVPASLCFASVVAGGACGGDPVPRNDESEYCDMEFVIDRSGGASRVRLPDFDA